MTSSLDACSSVALLIVNPRYNQEEKMLQGGRGFGRALAVAAGSAWVIALASAASTPAAAAGQKTIAIIVPTLKITVLQVESQAAVKKAEALGYKTTVLTHDFNTANELKDADALITEKVAGVAWNVADPAASAVAVKKVRDAGIPVVNMDRVLVKHEIANNSFQSDNFQCGALAAQALVDMVGGKGDYAELPGPSSDQMGRTRSAGYHSVLDKTALKMVAQQPAPYDQTKGFQLAGSILQAHPEIVAFATGNDSIGLGAAAAIKAQGKTGIVVVGIDGGADAVAAIKSGTSAFRATAAQPVAAQGEKSVEALDKIIRGEKGPSGGNTLLPCTLIGKK